jgi:hypothetical protein
MNDRERIGNIPESMTYRINQKNLPKSYERALRWPPCSSNMTEPRLHSYLFLRFRDIHVPYRLFPPLRFSCGDIARYLGTRLVAKGRSDISKVRPVLAPNTRKKFNPDPQFYRNLAASGAAGRGRHLTALSKRFQSDEAAISRHGLRGGNADVVAFWQQTDY